MVSMATHYAILKNEDVPTKILISQQQLILVYYAILGIRLIRGHSIFKLWFDMQII